jgi:hypothetical protein
MKTLLLTPMLTMLAALAFTVPVNAADTAGRPQSLIAEAMENRDIEPVTYRNRRWHRNHSRRHYNHRYRGDRYYYGGNNSYDYDRPYRRGYGFGFAAPGLFLDFGDFGGNRYRNRGYSNYGDGYGYDYDRRWR